LWVGRTDDALGVWERAYAAHLSAGDRCAAAATALVSAREEWSADRRSLAAGWCGRAQRLLADAPECVVHGYLANADWALAMSSGHYDRAAGLGERMLDLGTRFGDVDLQALGLLRRRVALLARPPCNGFPLQPSSLTSR
jgi:hypothetical protein